MTPQPARSCASRRTCIKPRSEASCSYKQGRTGTCPYPHQERKKRRARWGSLRALGGGATVRGLRTHDQFSERGAPAKPGYTGSLAPLTNSPIPEDKEPRQPKDYRPIVLAATLSKLFSKALLLRLRQHFPVTLSGQLSSQPGAESLDGSVALKHLVYVASSGDFP